MSKGKVRLSVDCSPELRQRLKVLCTISGETMSDWVMEAVRLRMKEESSKTPNKMTQEALQDSRRGKGVERHGSIEELFEDLGI